MGNFTINGRMATDEDCGIAEDYLAKGSPKVSDWKGLIADGDLSKEDALQMLDNNGDGYIEAGDDNLMKNGVCEESRQFRSLLKRFNLSYAMESDEIPEAYRSYGIADAEGKFLDQIGDGDRVVILGERHDDKNPKDFLVRRMSELRARGFTHIGFEMFPSEMQPLLDRYFETGEGEDEIKGHLDAHWERFNRKKGYFQIVQAARDAGMRIVGLDLDYGSPRTTVKDDENMRLRNETMASSIRRVVDADPKNRIVCLNGGSHVKGGISHRLDVPVRQFHFDSSVQLSQKDEDMMKDLFSDVCF